MPNLSLAPMAGARRGIRLSRMQTYHTRVLSLTFDPVLLGHIDKSIDFIWKLISLVRADGGKWICPIARSRRDIHYEHVRIEKGCKIGLETSNVRMSLRNEQFQNAARGPLKCAAPGPARRILKMFISKKTDRGRRPPHRRELKQGSICLPRPSQVVYISLVNLFT